MLLASVVGDIEAMDGAGIPDLPGSSFEGALPGMTMRRGDAAPVGAAADKDFGTAPAHFSAARRV